MATLNPIYANSCVAMGGGSAASSGQGEQYTLTVNTGWQIGDLWTIQFTQAGTGELTQIGAGYATGVQPTCLKTFNNKVYALDGSTMYFCGEDEPTSWNNPNDETNGFITMSDYYSTTEDLQALAPFQGNLAIISRRDCQIWTTDPDTANYAQTQVLPNIGTFAADSVQPIGDMDIYMIYDTGFRSLRVRVASDNAIIADIGTPIDAIIQSVLGNLTVQQKASCPSIVDPSQNRYWCFVSNPSDPDNGVGKIYVFSYFPSSDVAAWSTYSPSYQASVASPGANYPGSGAVQLTYTGLTVGKRYAWTPGAHEVSLANGTQTLKALGSFVATATTATVTGSASGATFTGALTVTTVFTPQVFCVLNGQVWVRDTNGNFYQVGGSNNNTYENCGVTANTPFIDGGSPGTRKNFEAIDAGFQGSWTIGMAFDYTTMIYKTLYTNTVSSFIYQRIGWGAFGTHFSGQLVESGNGYARFSNLLVHLKQADEK